MLNAQRTKYQSYNPFEGYPVQGDTDVYSIKSRYRNNYPSPTQFKSSLYPPSSLSRVLPVSAFSSPLLAEISDYKEHTMYRQAPVGVQKKQPDYSFQGEFTKKKIVPGAKECIEPHQSLEPAKNPIKERRERQKISDASTHHSPNPNVTSRYGTNKVKELLLRSPYLPSPIEPKFAKNVKDRRVPALGKGISRHTTDHLPKDYTYGSLPARELQSLKDLMAMKGGRTDTVKAERQHIPIDSTSMYVSANQSYGNGGDVFKRKPFRKSAKIASIETLQPYHVKDCLDSSGTAMHGTKFVEFKEKYAARKAWA